MNHIYIIKIIYIYIYYILYIYLIFHYTSYQTIVSELTVVLTVNYQFSVLIIE